MCGRSLRENAHNQIYSPERKEEILRAYHERRILRGITRIFGASRQSISKVNTNRLERFNCILRQRLGRLVRQTFSFSKTDKMHKVVLTLFLHHYNRSKLSP